MTSLPSGESKTGGGGPTPVYSATSCVPAVLANPLSVQATVLRRPGVSEEFAPELVEEGDILFSVLANPLYHSSTLVANNNELPPTQRRSQAAALSVHGVESLLSLPTSLGKHFVGQPFRAFLNFHNAATYPLSSLLFGIDCVHPTLQRLRLVSHDYSSLDAKGNASFTVEFVLREPGQHTLSVMVTYLDIVNETRRLTWSSSFSVERAIVEVHRTLNIVPVMSCHRKGPLSLMHAASGSTFQDVKSNIVLPKKKYIYSICLQNTSSVSLIIVSVKLHTGNAFECLPSPCNSLKDNPQLPLWWPRGEKGSKRDADAFGMHCTDSGTDALEDIHLHPKDKRCYGFELIMKPGKLQSAASCQGASATSSAVASSNFIDIGYVEWEWRCTNGDSGTERSNPIRLGGVPRQPTLELFVIGVRPETPKAGQPMTLECVVANYDAEKRVNLALQVRPEMLTPALVYAGPLLRPLGFIEPLGTLTFCVTLVPWQPGWVVLQGGLELCDARNTATPLWPPQPLATQSVPRQPTTGPSVVIMDAPKEPYPPVLCELLVG